MRKPYRKNPLNKLVNGVKNDYIIIACHTSGIGV
jgi:hypothetical protein